MISAVDTNVLLDVLALEGPNTELSKALLADALEQGELVICEPVYAELSSRFASRSDLTTFTARVGVRLALSDERVLHTAGAAWQRYSARRLRGLQCPSCGANNRVACSRCETPLSVRQHIIADFIIGAHAQLRAERLLTRDKGYYRTYFPELTLVS